MFDTDGNVQIKMAFDKIDLKTEFNDTYFDLNSILDTETTEDNSDADTNKDKEDNSNTDNTNNNETQEPSGEIDNTNSSTEDNSSETKETATIEDGMELMNRLKPSPSGATEETAAAQEEMGAIMQTGAAVASII